MAALKISQEILNIIYPVGSVYISTNSANPATLFGGTWEQIKGRFLVGCGSNGVDLYTEAGQTGGEANHKLTVNEMPKHNHMGRNYSHNWDGGVSIPPGRSYSNSYVGDESGKWRYSAEQWIVGSEINEMVETGDSGGSQAHNNMPPYLSVYMWYRTA